MCELQLGIGFTKSRMVFSCLEDFFFSGHLKSCNPQLPVPPGTNETEMVDKKGMWGQTTCFQPFPCDVVASSLAASSAVVFGWLLARASVHE